MAQRETRRDIHKRERHKDRDMKKKGEEEGQRKEDRDTKKGYGCQRKEVTREQCLRISMINKRKKEKRGRKKEGGRGRGNI